MMKAIAKVAGNSLILIALPLAVWGCAATGVGEAGKGISNPPRQVMIEKGMPAADLLAELGEPTAIEPTDPPQDGFEVWVYRRQMTHVDMQVTSMKETPYFDPITGVYRPIMDPVYSNETRTFREVTRFLIADGVVASWKVDRDTRRIFDD